MQVDEIFQQAMNQHQSGQLAEAEKGYQTVIQAKPDHVTAYQYLSHVQMGLGRVEEGLANLEKGLALDPNDFGVLSMYSSYYLNTNKPQKALEFAEKAASTNPNMPDAYFNLGSIYIKMQQEDKAAENMTKTLEINPNHAVANYNLGCLVYAKGELEKSIKYFEKAYQNEPTLLPALTNLAQASGEFGDYSKSIECYKKALQMAPDRIDIQQNLGMVLHINGQFKEALPYFEKIHRANPNNVEPIILIANIYRDTNKKQEAEEYYQKALDLNPYHPIAAQNIRRLKNAKIPNWHFEMLADTARNDAFQKAIEKAVNPNDTVLDIGAGSGLLSMMAVKAGAKKVIACELVKDLAETAEKVVADNNMSDKITIHNKKSNYLRVGEELEEKADVLVSEILDAGLLGEGVLPSFRHALAELVKPNAKVIPHAATVYGILLESEQRHRISPFKNISGFDLSAFDIFRVPKTYTQAHLNRIDHEPLSEVFPIYSLNFKQLPDTMLEHNPTRFQIDVNIQKDGVLHGVAFWFDLFIDEEIKLSTGPNGEMIHWGQALYMFEEARDVKKGETFVLDVYITDSQIYFA